MDGNRCSDDEIVTLSRVTKRYAAGVPGCSATVRALDGVSLVVRRGDAVAIVGGAGSGKSTLALCVTGLIRPDDGTIRWRGRRDQMESDVPVPRFVDVQDPANVPDVVGHHGGLLVIDSVDSAVTPRVQRRLRDLVALARRQCGVLILGRSGDLCRSLASPDGPTRTGIMMEGRLVLLDRDLRLSSRVAERANTSASSVDRSVRVP